MLHIVHMLMHVCGHMHLQPTMYVISCAVPHDSIRVCGDITHHMQHTHACDHDVYGITLGTGHEQPTHAANQKTHQQPPEQFFKHDACIYYQPCINISYTPSDGGTPVWLLKTAFVAVVLFGIFVLSGQIATWVFLWTGCLWTSSAIFGLSMLSAGTLFWIVSMWDLLHHLFS